MRARDTWLLRAAIGGVALYVGTWFVLGQLRPGYDPLRQAISELFATDAPLSHALTLAGVLVLTGAALVPFGVVLDRVLPGTGRLGPALVVVSGVGTLLVGLAPCTAGCPGVGASTTDTLHVVFAGGGYTALVTAPLAVAWRVRAHAPALARWSLLLGGVASAGFVVRNLGGVDALAGLQQRVFNTVADLWLAGVAWWALRRQPAARAAAGPRTGPRPRSAQVMQASDTQP